MIKNKIKEQAAIIYTKRFRLAFILIFIAITLWEFFYFSYKDKERDYTVNFNDSSRVISIHIPKNLNFAGEKVPSSDYKINKAFEKAIIANTFWKSQSILLHKRSKRWFPVIEPILKQYNIPDDFKYIALIESQLTNATSPKGAKGFWQFIESTARIYGLEVSEDVDERFNIRKSTEAAAKYFKDAYKVFGNWTLVAASYNRGISGIKTQMKNQNKEEYYDLALTKETSIYIFKILAMKEVISRPKIYGYDIPKNDAYPYVKIKTIGIDSSITSLKIFTENLGTHIKLVKAINPWLISNKLSNYNHKKYFIDLPLNTTSLYDVNGNFIDLIIESQSKSDTLNNQVNTLQKTAHSKIDSIVN